MTITDIKLRPKSMVAVYIDGEYAMDIDKQTARLNGIRSGIKINDEELHDIIKKSEEKRAKEKALYLLSHRDYSKKELIEKVKKSNPANATILAVDKMEELSFVDDERYAKKYAYDLINRKGFAISRVEYELFKKGIDKEIISNVVDDISIDTKEKILSIVNRKYFNCLKDEKGRKRTIAALQRLGYKWEDIKGALNEYLLEVDCEDEY